MERITAYYDPILAIDPGASGGAAYRDQDGNVETFDLEMPAGLLIELKASSRRPITLFFEDVPYGMASGAFLVPMAKLQRSAGRIEGAAIALGIRTILVKPQKWQQALGLGKRKSWGKKWKNHLKEEAQRRFPTVDVTLKNADALLILDYAMQGGVK